MASGTEASVTGPVRLKMRSERVGTFTTVPRDGRRRCASGSACRPPPGVSTSPTIQPRMSRSGTSSSVSKPANPASSSVSTWTSAKRPSSRSTLAQAPMPGTVLQPPPAERKVIVGGGRAGVHFASPQKLIGAGPNSARRSRHGYSGEAGLVRGLVTVASLPPPPPPSAVPLPRFTGRTPASPGKGAGCSPVYGGAVGEAD